MGNIKVITAPWHGQQPAGGVEYRHTDYTVYAKGAYVHIYRFCHGTLEVFN